jgi:DNA-binding transcriptional ArsR family regulator
MASAQMRPRDPTTRTVRAEEELRGLLRAIEDPDCRRILEATGGRALSANELTERYDLPSSTVYRKLERLTDLGLVEERIRIHRTGRHVSEYRRCVGDVRFSVVEGEAELELLREDREEPWWSLTARTEG